MSPAHNRQLGTAIYPLVCRPEKEENLIAKNICEAYIAKMQLLRLLSISILAPIVSLAAPTSDDAIPDLARRDRGLHRRENLCSMKTPPALCQANSSVTVAETAARAYKFYRAFVVDGDPRTMFSLIDSTYKVWQIWNSFHRFCIKRKGRDR